MLATDADGIEAMESIALGWSKVRLCAWRCRARTSQWGIARVQARYKEEGTMTSEREDEEVRFGVSWDREDKLADAESLGIVITTGGRRWHSREDVLDERTHAKRLTVRRHGLSRPGLSH